MYNARMGIAHVFVFGLVALGFRLGPTIYKNDPAWKLAVWRWFLAIFGAMSFLLAFYLP